MTNERKRRLAVAVLMLRERIQPPCSQPRLAEKLGYEDKQTIYRYEKFGPPAEALPGLAAFAREMGAEALAKEFLTAFMDEFPRLRELLGVELSVQVSHGTERVSATNERPLENPRISDIKDRRSWELHELLDKILALGMEEAVRPVESTMRFVLGLAPRKRGEK